MKKTTRIMYALAVIAGLGVMVSPQTGSAKSDNSTKNVAVQKNVIMDAPTALKKAESGELLLIDIRRPQEWKETGVGSVANKVSMHQPGFLQKLDILMGNDKSKPVALICAVGGRSTWLQTELQKRGYSNVINIAEGMLGSPSGPGWLKRGLPIVR